MEDPVCVRAENEVDEVAREDDSQHVDALKSSAIRLDLDGEDVHDVDASVMTVASTNGSPLSSQRSQVSQSFSSRGSASFGSSKNTSVRSFVTFASDVKGGSVESQSYDGVSPNSTDSRCSIFREDSFDRKKLTYKTTLRAEAKLDRAKILGVNEYTFLRTLGKGAFAEVKLATKTKLENHAVVKDIDIDNFERYAIKIVKKNFLQEKRKFQQIPSPSPLLTSPKPTPESSISSTPQLPSIAENGYKDSPNRSSRSLRMKNKRFSAPESSGDIKLGQVTPDNGVGLKVTPPSSRSLRMKNKRFSAPESLDQNNLANGNTTNTNVDKEVTPSPPVPSVSSPMRRPPASPKQESPVVPQEMLQEIEILKHLRHKNLVKLCEIIDDPSSKHLYIVLEYVEAGPVMIKDPKNSKAFISRLTNGVLLESMASTIFKDLMSVLEYLHLNHIAHRDIKPDNLLVDFNGNLKVADFGVSSHFSEEKRKKAVDLRQLLRSKSRGVVSSTEGTFAFYSPEMCRESSGGYSAYMSDVWASSVCLWIFIFGKLPFYNADVVDLFSEIRHHNPEFPHEVSPELKHLFGKLLEKNQENRLSVHDIQNHCWLKRIPFQGNGLSNDDFQTDDDLSSNIDDYRQLFTSNIYSRILRWANISRENCAARRKKFAEDTEAELYSMLKRSALAFRCDENEKSDAESSDDDDPLARLVSYDEIGNTVLEDMKKLEKHAAVKVMSALDEGDEKNYSPSVTPSPQQKKPLRIGRSKRSFCSNNSDISGVTDLTEKIEGLRPSLLSTPSGGSNSSDYMPTQELHDKLTKEALVELELEAYSMSIKKVPEDKESAEIKNCCLLS